MNLFKKITLGLATLVTINAVSAVNQINFDAFIKGSVSKAAAFKVLEEIAKKYPMLVVYFGQKPCKYCVKTEKAIADLSKEYSDVIFVMVNLAKYPFFKNGTWPKVRFLKNGISCCPEKNSLNTAELKKLLDQFYC